MNTERRETTKTYDFHNGTIVKHFVTFKYANGSVSRPITHYTVIKNGVESKIYYRIGNAMNFLDKESK